MIRRSILLVLYLVAGYVLGDLLAWLILIPIAVVKHLTDAWVGTVANLGGLIGSLVGLRNWRRGSAPATSWGVHGSARWANANEVRSLVRPDGLII